MGRERFKTIEERLHTKEGKRSVKSAYTQEYIGRSRGRRNVHESITYGREETGTMMVMLHNWIWDNGYTPKRWRE